MSDVTPMTSVANITQKTATNCVQYIHPCLHVRMQVYEVKYDIQVRKQEVLVFVFVQILILATQTNFQTCL